MRLFSDIHDPRVRDVVGAASRRYFAVLDAPIVGKHTTHMVSDHVLVPATAESRHEALLWEGNAQGSGARVAARSSVSPDRTWADMGICDGCGEVGLLGAEHRTDFGNPFASFCGVYVRRVH